MLQLKVLSLSNNLLREEDSFPSDISELPSLRYLYLSSNRLSYFPLPLAGITSLTGLDLQNNYLSSIPDDIKLFQRLSELYLHHNNLTELPPGLGRLSGLEWLALDNNRLQTLPMSMLSLPLRTLKLSVHKNWFLGQQEEGTVLFLNLDANLPQQRPMAHHTVFKRYVLPCNIKRET